MIECQGGGNLVEATENESVVHGSDGQITAVRGSVVEVWFSDGLPAINEALRLSVGFRTVILEVAQHLDLHTVRAIDMAPTEGLARGLAIRRTGGPITVAVGPSVLGRLFNVLGEPLDGGEALTDCESWPIHRAAPPLVAQRRVSEFLETGIKVVDLLAPLSRGGKAGLMAGQGSARRCSFRSSSGPWVRMQGSRSSRGSASDPRGQ